MEKRQASYTVVGNANWYSHCGQVWKFLKKLGIDLPYDQQSHCWAHTLRKPELRDTCTPVFIAVLFTIARTWNQPSCLSTDEWINKLYIYTREYYSAIRKNKIQIFAATWIDL